MKKSKNKFIFKSYTKKYILKIKDWKTIRATILERDNYSCRICGASAGDEALHCHHIDWERTNNKDNNLVTLCQRCHYQVHFENYKPCNFPDYKIPWDN